MTNASRIVHHFSVTAISDNASFSLLRANKARYGFTNDQFLTTKDLYDPNAQGDLEVDQTFNKITFFQSINSIAGIFYVSTETDPANQLAAVTTSSAAPSATTGKGFIPITWVASIINAPVTLYGQFSRLRMIKSATSAILTVVLEVV